MRIAAILLAGGVIVALALWGLSAPDRSLASALPDDHAPDIANGEQVFWAAGCASCHAAPDAEDRLTLSGGQRFPSDFGTFIAPNISPDPQAGIGDWSAEDFVIALQNGVSPEGRHYYPAFPYTAYRLAQVTDLLDLWAYMQTLPPSPTASQAHEVGFPFNIRRTLGLWKLLHLPDGYAVSGDLEAEAARGRYLSEALAHCGECHTPRNALGGLQRSAWLAGAPDPSGDGRVPDIRPMVLEWSAADIAAYLRDGFTPDFDSAGGHMADVVRNLSNLPEDDHAAIAAYLKALPSWP